VSKKLLGMYCHTHMVAVSTRGYVVLVVENTHATPRQQLKPIASTKSNAFHSHSCGVPQTTTPT